MTTNELALEPCPNPWCPTHRATDPEIVAAEAPILMPSKSSNEWAVACPVCPIQTPWFGSETEAIAAWNQRPQPDGDAVERDEVRKFALGDRVTKTKGSSWTGRVVGFYSTSLTPIGYAIESENEPGSVQIYPESALKSGGR